MGESGVSCQCFTQVLHCISQPSLWIHAKWMCLVCCWHLIPRFYPWELLFKGKCSQVSAENKVFLPKHVKWFPKWESYSVRIGSAADFFLLRIVVVSRQRHEYWEIISFHPQKTHWLCDMFASTPPAEFQEPGGSQTGHCWVSGCSPAQPQFWAAEERAVSESLGHPTFWPGACSR